MQRLGCVGCFATDNQNASILVQDNAGFTTGISITGVGTKFLIFKGSQKESGGTKAPSTAARGAANTSLGS